MPLPFMTSNPPWAGLARALAGAPALRSRCLSRVAITSEGDFGSEAAAAAAFERGEARLFKVAGWFALGAIGLRFALHGADGAPRGDAPAEAGDFIAITALPWSGPRWWVRVEAAERVPGRAALALRPSHDPTERPVRPALTAHFLSRRASLTLRLVQQGGRLVATAEGRDEVANTGTECPGPRSALLNRLVAEAGWGLNGRGGDRLGLPTSYQQAHWEVFTRNLVR